MLDMYGPFRPVLSVFPNLLLQSVTAFEPWPGLIAFFIGRGIEKISQRINFL